MIRQPAVAGRFYPDEPALLFREVDGFVHSPEKKIRALACMAPHAGYMYSGHVAGAVYGALELPSRFILLGPRHFPRGERLAILTEYAWRTPLGDVQVDEKLAAQLMKTCSLLREDAVAHETEHSLEVQLPFLQRLAGDLRFVPIVLGTDRFDAFDILGHAVAQVVRDAGEPVLIIASSDMNHYESDAVTRVKDRKALDRILRLDPRGLYDTVRRESISMCGYGPATTMLVAAKELGATEAELIRYATSGDINNDREQVVGYAGMIVR
ncbi:MAG TPA: AmmeMemoRadiSam system protein B [Candidatus Acidoferrales bacterium]|nr:AmmeMemoRadiSam system protein B [Candidatus Acidoferrales bacterium]